MRSNITVQELTVAAALSGKKEHVVHAAAMDPHIAAELSLGEIIRLVEQLIEAHGKFLPTNRDHHARL